MLWLLGLNKKYTASKKDFINARCHQRRSANIGPTLIGLNMWIHKVCGVIKNDDLLMPKADELTMQCRNGVMFNRVAYKLKHL